MRIVLIFFALELLASPTSSSSARALLLWIGVKLLLPKKTAKGTATGERQACAAAVKTILVADLVMSLDNVIAIAGAAKGSTIAADLRPGDHDPDHRLGQPAGDQADGPLPDHHHARRGAARLDRRHHGGQRSDHQGLGRCASRVPALRGAGRRRGRRRALVGRWLAVAHARCARRAVPAAVVPRSCAGPVAARAAGRRRLRRRRTGDAPRDRAAPAAARAERDGSAPDQRAASGVRRRRELRVRRRARANTTTSAATRRSRRPASCSKAAGLSFKEHQRVGDPGPDHRRRRARARHATSSSWARAAWARTPQRCSARWLTARSSTRPCRCWS